MLTETQIMRLAESGDFVQLTARILSNGRCRSPMAKRMLGEPDVLRIAALGLALQRISELSYRPTPMAERLAQNLASMQREDGLFCDVDQRREASSAGGERRRAATLASGGVECDSIIAASAVATRGLIAWRHVRDASPVADRNDRIERGLDALAAAFQSDVECGRLQQRAGQWAIVLWQLGDVESFRSRVPIDELLDLVEGADTDVIGDEISRYAQAVAA